MTAVDTDRTMNQDGYSYYELDREPRWRPNFNQRVRICLHGKQPKDSVDQLVVFSTRPLSICGRRFYWAQFALAHAFR